MSLKEQKCYTVYYFMIVFINVQLFLNMSSSRSLCLSFSVASPCPSFWQWSGTPRSQRWLTRKQEILEIFLSSFLKYYWHEYWKNKALREWRLITYLIHNHIISLSHTHTLLVSDESSLAQWCVFLHVQQCYYFLLDYWVICLCL